MTRLSAVILAICGAFALALAGAAGASDDQAPPEPTPTRFGVLDDYGKYSNDGGTWFFDELKKIGFDENKITVNWDPARPTAIAEQAFLDKMIPKATEQGIKVSFGVMIGKARAITGNRAGPQRYAAFLELLAKRYPEVTEFAIANEPNLSRFWQPQFSRNGTRIASAWAYTGLLARSYDTLKAINPEITVVGLSLSPRGNGNPRAKSNISSQPVKFIREMGRAYRASGRQRPLMDVFGFHPYPWRDRDSLEKGYGWPNAGVANLDRIKQAVWDAFHDTAQPTFAEGPPEADLPPVRFDPDESEPEPLTFKLDEVGWQVRIPASSRAAYHGRESVKPTTERSQARIYGALVRRAVCDRSIRDLLFFGLVDEANLDRWQAGLIRADRTPRPSYATVRAAIEKTGGRCLGRPVVWEHTEEVVGARASFRSRGRRFGFTATADEEATYEAAVFRLSGPTATSAAREVIVDSLASQNLQRAAAAKSGRLRAHWKTVVNLSPRKLAPGYYAYGVQFRATMNPERWSFVVSRAFRVQ